MDGSTTVVIEGAEQVPLTFAFAVPGKPHNWGVPNMVGNENDVLLYERWHPALAKAFYAALGATGHAGLHSAKGAETKVSLLQIDGGRDAAYVVAVNDSWIATQADWHQVQETLVPAKTLPADTVIYDCSDEKPLGKAAPLACDLTRTTARVFALLPRQLKTIALSATQSVQAGDDLVVQVEFRDPAGKPLVAVLPSPITWLGLPQFCANTTPSLSMPIVP